MHDEENPIPAKPEDEKLHKVVRTATLALDFEMGIHTPQPHFVELNRSGKK